jgi:WD40 repeat protein
LLIRVDSLSAQDQPRVEIAPILGHSDHVSSVAFSPDGARALSGSLDKTIKLWDAPTGADPQLRWALELGRTGGIPARRRPRPVAQHGRDD